MLGVAAARELLEDSLAMVRSEMAKLGLARSDAYHSLSAAQAKVRQLEAKAELLSNDEKSELGDAQRAVELLTRDIATFTRLVEAVKRAYTRIEGGLLA